jgi:hypothetical protein
LNFYFLNIADSETNSLQSSSVANGLLHTPLVFEKNVGQFDTDVRFVARSAGGITYYFSELGITIALNSNANTKQKSVQQQPVTMQTTNTEIQSDVLRVSYLNANPHPFISSEELLSSTTNYFLGNSRNEWKSDVENFSRIRYHNVYDGIDIVYYGNGKTLEYDFIIHPNANPNNIRLQYDGMNEHLYLEKDGSVAIPTNVGLLHEKKPYAYQTSHNEKNEVVSQWLIGENNQLQFSLANYNSSQTLFIDPILYSTFLGATSTDFGFSIAVDNNGNAYIAGITLSFNFPVSGGTYDASQNGGYDVFVTKLDSNGTLVYSTFVGGSGNEGNYYGVFLTIDNNGNAYVSGNTESNDFPTTAGVFDNQFDAGYCEAFAFKLNSSGSALGFSTYLGASYYDYGLGIAVDNSNNVFVTGMTYSADFPVTENAYDDTYNGGLDLFVTKLNPTATALIFSTFIGGTSDDYLPANAGNPTATDASGNVYVTGYTASVDFPVTNGAFDGTHNGSWDAFVFKFTGNGSIIYSTFLGGSGNDYGYGIEATDDGSAVVTGYTSSVNFPVTAGVYDNELTNYDCFVTKILPNGNSIQFSTFLGGTANDYAMDVALDNFGNIYLTGYTTSVDFPVTANGYDGIHNGGHYYGYDVFVTKMKSNGTALYYSSFLGGTSDDYGAGIDVDGSSNMYVTGYTPSTDFPAQNGFDVTHNGDWDAFVTKLSYTTGSISGIVFNDLNSNGVKDAGESGIANWKIRLAGFALDSALTNANGNYSFSDVAAGNYTVSEVLPSGWKQTFPSSPGTHSVTVAEGQKVTGKDFGNFLNGSISGKIFNDVNGNGTLEAGETGMQDWLVRLKKNNIVVDSTLSDVDGDYAFTNLNAGTYEVVEKQISGWLQITPDYTPFVITGGTVFADIDFGNFQTGMISGLKFYDANNNGSKEANENGIANWKIRLKNTGTQLQVDSALTDGYGNYQFSISIPGEYEISEEQQSGWTQTSPQSGTHVRNMLSGSNFTGVNFGNYQPPASLSGMKFNDANANGTKDAGETGIANWKILISGSTTDSTTTNANGNYVFANLFAGSYTLSEESKSGWIQSYPSSGTHSVTLSVGENLTGKDFGNYLDTLKFRTFKADTSLASKTVKLSYTKSGALKYLPNARTAVEHVFKKIGKTGATFIGIPQGKDSAKYYAWVHYKSATDLGKLYTSPHGLVVNLAFPLDSLRNMLTGRNAGKKLAKLVKVDRKKYNNVALEQGAALKLNLLASLYEVTPKGFGSLVLDTPFTFVGTQLQGKTLWQIDSLFDTTMTFFKRKGMTNITEYERLYDLSVYIFKRINDAFYTKVDTANVVLNKNDVIVNRNAYAITLKGTKTATEVSILKRSAGKTFADFSPINNGVEPTSFALLQNYPNPFNPSTAISFQLSAVSNVALKVYDVLGREVATLIHNREMDEGMHEVQFDASGLTSGVYFYRLQAGEFSATKKLLLMK